MSFIRQLIEMSACQDAIDWVENRTLEQAWCECPYGDWMLWLLEKMEGKEEWLNEKEIMLLGCWCIRRVLKYIPEGETKPLKAIEAKEKWARGEITKKEMLAINETVIAIAKITANDSNWTAARAITCCITRGVTSNTASIATFSAACDTASATSDVANAPAWVAKRNKELLIQADYIRTQFTPPV